MKNKETLEEAIQKVSNSDEFNNGALFAYQWQQEQDKNKYSDFIQFGKWLLSQDITLRGEGVYVDDKGNLLTVKDLFEQFKNK